MSFCLSGCKENCLSFCSRLLKTWCQSATYLLSFFVLTYFRLTLCAYTLCIVLTYLVMIFSADVHCDDFLCWQALCWHFVPTILCWHISCDIQELWHCRSVTTQWRAITREHWHQWTSSGYHSNVSTELWVSVSVVAVIAGAFFPQSSRTLWRSKVTLTDPAASRSTDVSLSTVVNTTAARSVDSRYPWQHGHLDNGETTQPDSRRCWVCTNYTGECAFVVSVAVVMASRTSFDMSLIRNVPVSAAVACRGRCIGSH